MKNRNRVLGFIVILLSLFTMIVSGAIALSDHANASTCNSVLSTVSEIPALSSTTTNDVIQIRDALNSDAILGGIGVFFGFILLICGFVVAIKGGAK